MQSRSKQLGREVPGGVGIIECLSHQDSLRTLAQRVVRSSHDAEDVVQDVMLQALNRPPRDVRDLGGWLRVATLRTAVRHRNKGSKRAHTERDAAGGPELPSFLEDFLHQASLVELARSVARLPEPYASAVRLRYLEGASYPEMARRLEITEVAARARVKRGLDQLRDRLEKKRIGFFSLLLAPLLPVFRSRTRFAGTAAVVSLAALVAVSLLTKHDAPEPERLETASTSSEEDVPRVARAQTPASGDRRPVEDERVSNTSADAEGSVTPPKLLLRGSVLSPDGPLVGARIHVSEVASNPAQEPWSGDTRTVEAIADGVGRFELQELPGDTWVWAEADGWKPSFRFRLDTLDASRRTNLELRLTDPVDPLAFRVTTPANEPVVGANLSMGLSARPYWGAQGGLQVRSVRYRLTTDAAGIARGWSVGPATPLMVEAPGYVPWIGRLRDAVASGDERLVQLVPSQPVSGVLLDPEGRAVAGATIVARPLLRDGEDPSFETSLGTAETQTDEQGAFVLRGAPRPFEVIAFDARDASRGAATFRGDVPEGDLLELALDPRAVLTGHATEDEEALVGWRVLLSDPEAREQRRWTVTGEDGRFAFPAVTAREASVFLFPPHPNGSGESRADDATGIPAAHVKHVAAGQHLALAARPMDAFVRGQLARSREHQVTERFDVSLELRVADPLASPVRLQVDPLSGTWSSAALPAGEYELYLVSPGIGVSRLQSFTLHEGQELDLEELPLPRTGQLRVRYAWSEELPTLHGWSLERRDDAHHLFQRHADRRFVGRDVELLEDGFVIDDLLPGDYLFTIKTVASSATTHAVTIGCDNGRVLDEEVSIPVTAGRGVRLEVHAPRARRSGETIDLVWIDADGVERVIRKDYPLRAPGQELIQLAWYFAAEDCVVEARTSEGLSGRRLLLSDEMARSQDPRILRIAVH